MQKPPYLIRASRDAYQNPRMRVQEDDVELPSGERRMFAVLHLVPGATTIPLDDDGNVVLLEEYAHANGRYTLNGCSGGLEPNESPEDGARRELKEELGLGARELVNLGVLEPFTSFVNSPNHMFLARGLFSMEYTPDPWEPLKIVRMPFHEALQKVLDSEITHGASCVAILKAARLLRK